MAANQPNLNKRSPCQQPPAKPLVNPRAPSPAAATRPRLIAPRAPSPRPGGVVSSSIATAIGPRPIRTGRPIRPKTATMREGPPPPPKPPSKRQAGPAVIKTGSPKTVRASPVRLPSPKPKAKTMREQSPAAVSGRKGVTTVVVPKKKSPVSSPSARAPKLPLVMAAMKHAERAILPTARPSCIARNEMKALDQQPWYHGLCSREDVEQLLTKPGHFVVRASDSDGPVKIVLSFFTGERKVHLTLETTPKGFFYLKVMRREKVHEFPTVFDLVRYYKTNRIKLKGENGAATDYRLREGVPRPKWKVSSDLIAYDQTTKPLGSGHFAAVYIGKFWPNGVGLGEELDVAIKVMKAHSGTAEEREAKQGMIKEGKAMSFYNHPNVVQFYGVACDRPQQVILVMEFCPGGSLDKHLISQGASILIGERITFCIESALGMRYLHSQGCLHRDLAARNCLISSQGIVKIADFGLCAKEGVIEKQKLGNMPIRWMSPETLVKEPFFSTKSDVWAYGILIYEIFNNGNLPWPKEDNKKIATHIRHCQMPSLPPMAPPIICALVKSIWIKSCEDRPSFREIVQKLRLVRESGLKMPEPEICSVNSLPNVHRTTAAEDLGDEGMPGSSAGPSDASSGTPGGSSTPTSTPTSSGSTPNSATPASHESPRAAITSVYMVPAAESKEPK